MSYPKGRPRTNHPPPLPPLERFWPKVDRSGDGCWEWQGFVNAGGYGRFRIGDHHHQAHRAAWMLLAGPIPDGLFVCHHCDNPRCVRLSHLFLGSPLENMQDRDRKGRGRVIGRPGERNPNALLTDEKVRAIRSIYAAGGTSHRELAAQFGVAVRTIRNVISGARWAHVDAAAEAAS